MKIKELMNELKKYDENLEVVVDGYEGGYDNPKVYQVLIKPVPYESGYCGYFESSEEDEEGGFDALCISRYEEN